MPQGPTAPPALASERSMLLELLHIRHSEIRAICARQSQEAVQMRQAAQELRRRNRLLNPTR